MKILLAGASGLVGYEVLRLLHAAGHEVRTLSRDPGRAERLRPLSSDVRLVDATAPGALAGLCDGIEVVVSALGAPVASSANERRSFAEVDTAANLALLDEARRAGVRRFVYVGVHIQQSYAHSAYAQAHRRVEEALAASGLEHAAIRPTGIFGALGELLTMARKGPLPVIAGGGATTNPVHEIEVAEAVVRAVTSPRAESVDLGGPETLTRKQIAQLAFEALGRPPRLLRMPRWAMALMAVLFGLFNRRMGEFLRFVVLVSVHPCVAPAAGTRRLREYYEALAKQG